jgi:DNA/RNA-binding domain of Phe-tRNA-synthetase-like protein
VSQREHPALRAGFVEARVLAEFPQLRLDWVAIDASPRDSPSEVKRQLRELADRYRGATVVMMRTKAVPHAYRSFFRQIGLDPDVDRVPSEQAAVTRLLDGGFRSRDLVHDSVLIALVETGVAVWALDARHVAAGGLGIRTTAAGDRLGGGVGRALAPGRLAVADEQRVHALLFGELAAGHRVSADTQRVVLFTVGVAGVPAIHVEEALWLCVELLHAG